MGTAAFANIAIGLRPSLLFDLLPAPEPFVPYTAAKLVESPVLLGVTALAFVVLRARLTPKATTSLDTDVVYRELPVWLAPRLRPRVGSLMASLPRPALAAVPTALRRAVPGPGGPVAPGWLLGGSVAGAMVFVLALTVAVR
jgi:multicomponent Na+:H+ antiporter subunit D